MHIPWNNEKDGRIETGVVKFGDDWAGTFIRGDNSFFMAQSMRAGAAIARLHANHFNNGLLIAAQLERTAYLLTECVETKGSTDE